MLSDRPKVLPLTRLQTRKGGSVTNQWHQRALLGPFERELAQFLDGAHDLGQLEIEVARLIKSGGQTGKDAAAAAGGNAREKVGQALEKFRQGALLIG